MEDTQAKLPWHVVAMPDKEFVSGHATEPDARSRAAEANAAAAQLGSETHYVVLSRTASTIPTSWINLGP